MKNYFVSLFNCLWNKKEYEEIYKKKFLKENRSKSIQSRAVGIVYHADGQLLEKYSKKN